LLHWVQVSNHPITAQTVEPYAAEEIAWTCVNIMGIVGADNFPFDGDVSVYIKASMDWYSWELPPLFFSLPKILDQYGEDSVKTYVKAYSATKDMSIADIASLDIAAIKRISGAERYLANYLLMNVGACKYIVSKRSKLFEDEKTVFGE